MEDTFGADIKKLEEEFRRFFLPEKGSIDIRSPLFNDLKKTILYLTAGILLKGKKFEPERQSSSFKGGYGELRKIKDWLDPDDYKTLQDLMREYTGEIEKTKLGGKIHIRYDRQMDGVMDMWIKSKIQDYITYELNYGGKKFNCFTKSDDNFNHQESNKRDSMKLSEMIFEHFKNSLFNELKTFYRIELESLNMKTFLDDLDEFTRKRLSVHKKKFQS